MSRRDESVAKSGPEASKGARTRAAILAAAAEAFRDQGYDATTLEDIAGGLGLTRSAVLHHFSSKADILVELVRPLFARIDHLLDRAEQEKLTPAKRREFFISFVDLVLDNRAVAAMTVRDVTASAYLPPDLQVADRALRFVRIAAAADADNPRAAVRGLAALGAVLRPVSAEAIDLDDPAARTLLVDCAAAVSRVRLPPV
jgi:AcrR family transcriptional regulator